MHVLKFIVANNILRLRTDAEMSREELGEKIHYSEEFILKWERAETMPDDEELALLAEALGVTADYLLNPHDEWVSKEEKEYLENAATLAPNMETKNIRAEEEAPEPAQAAEATEKKPKKKKKSSALHIFICAAIATVGLLYIGADSGLIGCQAESDYNMGDMMHAHEYGDWEMHLPPTEYSDGEMRRYCYICGEYISSVVSSSTQGLFYENLGNGTCIVTGVGHGPENNNNLTRVVVPQFIVDGDEELRVVAIGDDFLSTFGDVALRRIKEIVLPDTVKTIGRGAFCNTGIETMLLPKSVESIGDYAFAGCNNLVNIEFSGNILHLGEGVFSECTSLESIHIDSDRLSEILPNTFANCTSLSQINLRGIKLIGENAFAGCESLRDIHTDALERIEANAFRGCEALEVISINDRIRYIGDSAFEDCKSLKFNGFYVSDDNVSNKITIGNNAFKGCQSLEDLTLHRVISIGEYAFADCTSLAYVTVYAEEIGMGAFSGCGSLAKAELFEGVRHIGSYAFERCGNISDVSFPATVEWVGDYAFGQCTNLSSISTNGAVEYMGLSAFEGCDGLKNITLYDMSGANFDVIFKGNQTIEDVAVSYGVIPDCAFYGCTALRYVTLFDGVTDIGNSAFAEIGNDIHPVSVVLPKNSYYTIDDCAFYAAYIEHIDIGGYIGYLGSKAFGESSLKEVVIRGNIDAMGESVFMSCHYLTSIIIEDGITEIHEAMFADCEYLESIVIPASMMKIGDRAFYRCFDLDTISYGGTKDDWERITKGEFWSDGADSGNVTVTCRDGDIYLYI